MVVFAYLKKGHKIWLNVLQIMYIQQSHLNERLRLANKVLSAKAYLYK